MNSEIAIAFELTIDDFIEAAQLDSYNKSNFKWQLSFAVLFLSLAGLYLYRIKDPNFLVIDRFKQVYVNRDKDELILDISMYSIFSLLYIGQLFPKINPLSRWGMARNLRQNFVKRELRQLAISPTELTISSRNYRSSLQWQGIDKIAENQKIFLLYFYRNKERIIIPKRISKSETEVNYFRQLSNNE